jgi:hypothetical protein
MGAVGRWFRRCWNAFGDVRRLTPSAPQDALEKAAVAFRADSPALLHLEAQAFVRRNRTPEWAATWAAINDVAVWYLQSEARRADDAAYLRDLSSVRAGAIDRRNSFASTPEFEAEVERLVTRIVPGNRK